MGVILSVNLAVPRPSRVKGTGVTGIDKQPAETPVTVRDPGPRDGGLGSGLVGDLIGDPTHHGGDDQAVYAYAREDYDWWEQRLGRPLPSGTFGENLTTSGLDVNGAGLGQRWRVGRDLLLQVTYGRIPCATFQEAMGEPRWVKRFTHEARPGAYLRVVEPGQVSAGDPVTVVHRPDDPVTVAEAFRAWTTHPELLPRLLVADGVPESLRAQVRRRLDR